MPGRSKEHPALDNSTLDLIDIRNKKEYDTDRAAQASKTESLNCKARCLISDGSCV